MPFHTVSVIIPAHNESKTLASIIEKVRAADVGSLEKEIIVVDNDSTDDTFLIASAVPGVKVFVEEKKGKGAAVKRGFKEASGDIFLIQDADLEYDPGDYRAVLEPIVNGTTEAVNGVRNKDTHQRSQYEPFYLLQWVGNTAITITTNVLYLNNAQEYEGCYKAFTRKLIESISVSADSFDFDNELICKILKRGHTLVDVPIRYHSRGYAEGKQINWKHGFLILWTILKCRFTD